MHPRNGNRRRRSNRPCDPRWPAVFEPTSPRETRPSLGFRGTRRHRRPTSTWIVRGPGDLLPHMHYRRLAFLSSHVHVPARLIESLAPVPSSQGPTSDRSFLTGSLHLHPAFLALNARRRPKRHIRWAGSFKLSTLNKVRIQKHK